MVAFSVLLTAASRLAYWPAAQFASLVLPTCLGQPFVGGQAGQRLVVVDGPVAVGVDVVGLLHDPARPGPVGRDQVRGVLDARLGLPGRPLGAEVGLDEAQVTGLEQVDGPDPGVGPHPVVVLGLGADHVPGPVQQRVRAGEVALAEQVGQDADHVVAELGVVPVGPGAQLVAGPDDLGVDEPGPVRVGQAHVGQAGDLRDLGELAVPERLHVREVLVIAARGGQRGRRWPRVAAAEPVGRHHVVVVDAGVRGDRVALGGVERDQAG